MLPDDFWISVALLGSIVFFGGAAVLALAWGFRSGQFENFHRGARAIFDPDEPVGRPTDHFPKSDNDSDDEPPQGKK